jgi:hypothetical protein
MIISKKRFHDLNIFLNEKKKVQLVMKRKCMCVKIGRERSVSARNMSALARNPLKKKVVSPNTLDGVQI